MLPVWCGRVITFQLTEVAIPQRPFVEILRPIDGCQIGMNGHAFDQCLIALPSLAKADTLWRN